ncbi:MAG: hypothetical protein PUP92_29015 [Rhizonema sp. PD38]|nr:hypothetical protein [Rhizonema sp. PD38]
MTLLIFGKDNKFIGLQKSICGIPQIQNLTYSRTVLLTGKTQIVNIGLQKSICGIPQIQNLTYSRTVLLTGKTQIVNIGKETNNYNLSLQKEDSVTESHRG